MTSKCKTSNAGNTGIPKRSHKELVLSEILQLNKEKDYMLRLLRSRVRPSLLFIKLRRRKKYTVIVVLLYY
jgi:hypothetical protein